MLSLNDFENYINKVIKYYQKDSDLSDIMEVEGFIMYSSELIDVILNLLEEVMEDKEDQWIQYWCWECDFGKDAENIVHDADGKVIQLTTIKDLYFLLLKGRGDD